MAKSQKPWWMVVHPHVCHCTKNRLCDRCKSKLTPERKQELIAESSKKERKKELKKLKKVMKQFHMATTGSEELDRDIRNV